jgi:hypothetical protein
VFNRRTMPWFGEHFVAPRDFPATTPEKIMAGFSAAPAALESLPEIFGSA